MDYIFKATYHRPVSVQDIENVFIRKFRRVHNISYDVVRRRVKIYYVKPYDIDAYYKNLSDIAKTVNDDKTSMYFMTKVSQVGTFPDYVICDGDLFDIPIDIDF